MSARRMVQAMHAGGAALVNNHLGHADEAALADPVATSGDLSRATTDWKGLFGGGEQLQAYRAIRPFPSKHVRFGPDPRITKQQGRFDKYVSDDRSEPPASAPTAGSKAFSFCSATGVSRA